MKVINEVGETRELSEKQIAERIQKNCGGAWAELFRSKAFAIFAEQVGMSRTAFLPFLMDIATRRLEMDQRTKDAFRRVMEIRKNLAEHIENETRGFVGAPPDLKHLPDELRNNSVQLEQLISRKGQKYEYQEAVRLGIVHFLRAIRSSKKEFKPKHWEAAAHVLAEALYTAGIKGTEHITAEMLGKKSERLPPIFKGE